MKLLILFLPFILIACQTTGLTNKPPQHNHSATKSGCCIVKSQKETN
jgi:hypothetical protein